MLYFFFNDTATTEIYTLSLHDALPICAGRGPDRREAHAGLLVDQPRRLRAGGPAGGQRPGDRGLALLPAGVHVHDPREDRKSTRLNSSHANISYAVFCLKKKTC